MSSITSHAVLTKLLLHPEDGVSRFLWNMCLTDYTVSRIDKIPVAINDPVLQIVGWQDDRWISNWTGCRWEVNVAYFKELSRQLSVGTKRIRWNFIRIMYGLIELLTQHFPYVSNINARGIFSASAIAHSEKKFVFCSVRSYADRPEKQEWRKCALPVSGR
jgi:hypothetical protein